MFKWLEKIIRRLQWEHPQELVNQGSSAGTQVYHLDDGRVYHGFGFVITEKLGGLSDREEDDIVELIELYLENLDPKNAPTSTFKSKPDLKLVQ